MNQSIQSGEILSDRYRIIREIGHGGFGRTYLAEDTNRFNERCVLKEFAPQLQGTSALQKAQELFEREAGVLYKLQHSQIPKFRELLRVRYQERERLFLVQDYIEGQTYWELLQNRRQQGLRFTELDIAQLLFQILPVLDYIHSVGVIHRDISPDNLMLRRTDALPIIIDFGGVKQAASLVVLTGDSEPTPVATRIGKLGYAPDEQMQRGVVSPSSDLYALAATAIVLLTGKEPTQLLDPHTLDWNWRSQAAINPQLTAILDQMLAKSPGDRFESAKAVLQALNTISAPTTLPPVPPPSSSSTPSPVSNSRNRFFTLFGKIFIGILLIFSATGIGWLAGNVWLGVQGDRGQEEILDNPEDNLDQNDDSDIAETLDFPLKDDAEPEPSLIFSPEERQRKIALRERRLQLRVNYDFYIDLVNEEFWKQYPTQRERILTEDFEDEPWRRRWDIIAEKLLSQLTVVSSEVRRNLGNYSRTDLERWKGQVNKLRLSSRALYDLADAKFFYYFPEQEEEDFLSEPIGQVWQGIVLDQLKALQSGESLEQIVFASGTVGRSVIGTLEPGEGKAYIAQLDAGQLMDISLQATQTIQFSVYSPTGRNNILENSEETFWSGILPETGFYELILVSEVTEPFNYQLNLTVESPVQQSIP